MKSASLDSRDCSKTLHCRYAHHGDGEEVSKLFREVFNEIVSPEWWGWKYSISSSPGSIAFDGEGKIIGFYGALPREARFGEACLKVCQQTDVMVSKSHRFATRGFGVFKAMSELFLFHHVGEGKAYALSFGFPNERHLRLGVHFGLYRVGGGIKFWRQSAELMKKKPLGLKWKILSASDIHDWRWLVELSPPSNDPEVLILEKTPEYWSYRYSKNPSSRYDIVLVSQWGRMIAAVVVISREDCVEIMDIASRGEKKWHQAIRVCSHIACQRGFRYLTAWGTECAIRDFPQGEILDEGYLALPGPKMDVPLVEKVMNKCWLLGGDTDFR